MGRRILDKQNLTGDYLIVNPDGSTILIKKDSIQSLLTKSYIKKQNEEFVLDEKGLQIAKLKIDEAAGAKPYE